LGSGFILKRYNRINNNWKVLMIRGPLSAKQCEPSGDFIYGDPGILASLVFKDKLIKKHKIGIVLHSVDYEEVKDNLDKDIFIINPRRPAVKVAKDIMQCEFITSSSLHGLIFADAYNIPNIHLKFGDKVIGGLHKFDDYYLGMGIINPPKPLIYTNSVKSKEIIKNCKINFSNEIIQNKQKEIIEVYKMFFEINNKK